MVQFNGFISLEYFGIRFATWGGFQNDSNNLAIFSSGVEVVGVLSALGAVPTVWQISHKMLLISGALIMAQCWVIFYFLVEVE